MNKNIYIICAIFALTISCKNFASGEDLKQNLKKQVKGFLDTKKEELVGGLGNFKSKIYSKVEELMQAEERSQEQVDQGVIEDSELKEIEKQVKELKEKIDKADPKNTPLGTYSKYEEKIKELKGKLEEKLKDKEELKKDKEKAEKELKDLEDSLKKKKDERKKALEEANQKFQEFKKQVDSTAGVTQGQQAKNQGGIGGQAWKYAKELGFKSMTNGNSNTSDMVNEVIINSLKKIEEELKEIGEDKKE
ncbi:hypothetical protein QIA23_05645 (plasmid) [Borreliella lanei]